MYFEKVLLIFGCILTLLIAAEANSECPNGICRLICEADETEQGHCCRNRKCCVTGGCTEAPECTCKDLCDASETDNGQCVCDPTKRCCTPCTEAPECTCKDSCDASETDNGQCVCDPTKRCCTPCTEQPECICRDSCGFSEDDNGPCSCDSSKKCCVPCIKTDVCLQIGGACNNISGCDSSTEAVFGECCDGDGTCCVPCGTCDGNDVTCELNTDSCSSTNPNDLGPCCDGTGNSGRCCSATLVPCVDVVRPGSTVPFSCKIASSDECGSSVGGSVNTGYCPTNNIKCCPECGWDCFDLHGGQTCKGNSQCSTKITVSGDDCCSPTQCCADPV